MAFRLIRKLQIHPLVAEVQPQVICFSSLGRQMDRFSDPLGGFLEGSRLPLRADIMFSWVDLKKEIRFPLVRSHPISIDSDTHGRGSDKIYKKIDQSFALFRLPSWMLQVCRLHVEHPAARTASSRSSRHRRIILRKNWQGSQGNRQA